MADVPQQTHRCDHRIVSISQPYARPIGSMGIYTNPETSSFRQSLPRHGLPGDAGMTSFSALAETSC